MRTFAQQLKTARKKAGLNRREFAAIADIPYRTLQDWEDGKRTPPDYTQVGVIALLKARGKNKT